MAGMGEDDEVWDKFAQQVGWYVSYEWTDYENMPFSIKSDKGNLPALIWGRDSYNQGFQWSHFDTTYGRGGYVYANPIFSHQSLTYKEHPGVAMSLNKLANLYYLQGRYEEAEPLYQQALEMRRNLLGQKHPDVAMSLNNLANLYRLQERYKNAETLYQLALEMKRKLTREDLGQKEETYDFYTILNLNDLAYLYESQGYYEDAEPLYQKALNIVEKKSGSNDPDALLKGGQSL